MKVLYFFMVGILIFSCSEPISYQESLADEIIAQYNKKMTMQEKMVPVGCGGSMMNEIKSFFFAYNCPRVVNVDEARELALGCLHQLMEMVDAKEEIRQFLIEYPFPPSGLEMIITFLQPEHSDNTECINTIFIKEGKIYYRRYDYDSGQDVRWFETYEEALQKASE